MPKNKDTELFKHIGFKIRIKRRELKLSQEKLAEILNVAYTQVYNYEIGKFKIPIDYLLKLANIFNVDLNYFIAGFNSGTEELVNEDLELEDTLYMIKNIYKSNNYDLIFAVHKCVTSIHSVIKK
ncbi:MAG: helix-turn-helix domain-containing protein [bacterium]